MTNKPSPVDIARGFASELGVNLDADMQKFGVLAPHLVQLDTRTKSGGPITHITDEKGADYYAALIAYNMASSAGANAGLNEKIAASRAIAVVMQGGRTKCAYWPKGAQPKVLTVHRGHGSFIVGTPVGDELDRDFDTEIYSVDAKVTPQITVQPGQLYTIEAASWSEEPLVVSAFSQTDAKGNWEQAEVLVEAGSEVLDTPDGPIVVPEEFATAEFN